jgi:site-specific DNA recombinase
MKLDRLSRNVRDFLGLVDELQAVGCDLVLLKESFDTSTPHGRFALTMFAAMAELEAATITERVMSGKKQKASVGGYNGARCPLGYTYNDGVFVANDRAADVQKIFSRFVAGESFSKIATWLNESQIPTATGNGSWYPAGVRYIVSNGFYAGLAQWDGIEEQAGLHPAIVSVETYEQAQQRIAAIKPGPQG